MIFDTCEYCFFILVSSSCKFIIITSLGSNDLDGALALTSLALQANLIVEIVSKLLKIKVEIIPSWLIFAGDMHAIKTVWELPDSEFFNNFVSLLSRLKVTNKTAKINTN